MSATTEGFVETTVTLKWFPGGREMVQAYPGN